MKVILKNQQEMIQVLIPAAVQIVQDLQVLILVAVQIVRDLQVLILVAVREVALVQVVIPVPGIPIFTKLQLQQ